MLRIASPMKLRLVCLSLPWPNQPSMIRPVTWFLPYPSPTQYPETHTHNPDPDSVDPVPEPDLVGPDQGNPYQNRVQDLNLVRSRRSLTLVESSSSISDCLHKNQNINQNECNVKSFNLRFQTSSDFICATFATNFMDYINRYWQHRIFMPQKMVVYEKKRNKLQLFQQQKNIYPKSINFQYIKTRRS